jgi:arylsulfatase A-like enzyme
MARIDWRDVPLPAGYPADRAERERILDGKPRHWRLWYDGALVSNYEAPTRWVPATLTPDQVREVNARNAVEVELIDEALGRVLAAVAARGWADDLDVVYTSDHGELQGDFGLLFKGPYHVDALMRLPLVWRPAPSAGGAPSVVSRPVGLVDLAPTFCRIAGLPAEPWMEGAPLPPDDTAADADPGRSGSVFTEWDSELLGVDVHLRSVTRDGWVCTAYRPGTVHDGSEGELYDLADDPLQRVNRWDDPAAAAVRADLVDELAAHARSHPARSPRLPLEAPV